MRTGDGTGTWVECLSCQHALPTGIILPDREPTASELARMKCCECRCRGAKLVDEAGKALRWPARLQVSSRAVA